MRQLEKEQKVKAKEAKKAATVCVTGDIVLKFCFNPSWQSLEFFSCIFWNIFQNRVFQWLLPNIASYPSAPFPLDCPPLPWSALPPTPAPPWSAPLPPAPPPSPDSTRQTPPHSCSCLRSENAMQVNWVSEVRSVWPVNVYYYFFSCDIYCECQRPLLAHFLFVGRRDGVQRLLLSEVCLIFLQRFFGIVDKEYLNFWQRLLELASFLELSTKTSFLQDVLWWAKGKRGRLKLTKFCFCFYFDFVVLTTWLLIIFMYNVHCTYLKFKCHCPM